MKKINIGVYTQLKDRDLYLTLLNTWGKDFDKINIFCGYEEDRNYNPDNVILLDVEDSYNGLMEKQMRVLEYMFDNDKSEWYYVCGCDTFLYREHAEQMLNKFDSNKEIYVGGHCGVMESRFKSEYRSEIKHRFFPSGGAGFFVSNSLMKKIKPDIDKIIKEWIYTCDYKTIDKIYGSCDIGFGYIMSQMYDICVTTLCEMKSDGLVTDGFYSFNANFYPHTNNEIGTIILIDNPISYHYVKPHDMYRLYENKKKNIFK